MVERFGQFFTTTIAAALVVTTILAGTPVLAQDSTSDVLRRTLDNFLNPEPEAKPATTNSQVQVPQSMAEVKLSFAPLVKEVVPAVVNVYAARKMVQRSPFSGDPFFEFFMGRRNLGKPKTRMQSSLGSGVFVRADGIVVTNNHVVANADEVKIALSDGREFECTILLKDERSDLAILKAQSDEAFPFLPIGNSDNAAVGDLVLAIGNPFGVGQTVTSGIISAIARTQVGVNDFGSFIQTDAAINPGNSGGALVDMQGNLVGINTAIFSRSGGSNGIGFAIPANMVRAVLRSSEAGNHRVTRPWLGAGFQTVTPDIAENLGMARPSGAIVVNVVAASPAKRAGINVGDVVLAINGQHIEHPDAIGYRLATIGIGGQVEFTLLSRGRRVTTTVAMEAAPETVARDEHRLGGRSPFTGAVVANLSPAVAEELGIPANKSGVIVIEVPRRTLAERYKIRPGDIIRTVNDVEVENTQQMAALASERPGSWDFIIERGGRLLRRRVR